MVYQYRPRTQEAKDFMKKLDAAKAAYQKLPPTWQGRERQKKMAKKLQGEMVNTSRNIQHRIEDLQEDLRHFQVAVESYGPCYDVDIPGIYFWFTGDQSLRRRELF